MVEYYLANKAGAPATITITDANGETIKEFSGGSDDNAGLAAEQGVNRFFWDMKYPGTVMPPPNGALDGFMSVDYSPPTSPLAPPGQYKVRLAVNGEVFEQPFEIQKDPRTGASDADLKAQFELMVDIRDRFTEVSNTVLKIREVRAALNEKRADLPESAADDTGAILDELRQIEGILMIWMGTEAHPMMWSPPGLTEKLSALSSAVSSGDIKPTPSMVAVFADITERFEIQRNRLNQIIDQELAPSAP